MPMENNISSCVCSNQDSDTTLTLTHDFTDNKTTMTFAKDSQVFSFSVENDSSIIRQALEETLIHI